MTSAIKSRASTSIRSSRCPAGRARSRSMRWGSCGVDAVLAFNGRPRESDAKRGRRTDRRREPRMTKVLVIEHHADAYAAALRAEFPDLPVLEARHLSEAPDDLSGIELLIAF